MENMIKKIVDADNEARAMEENIKKKRVSSVKRLTAKLKPYMTNI